MRTSARRRVRAGVSNYTFESNDDNIKSLYI
jgi:hypothetical protein